MLARVPRPKLFRQVFITVEVVLFSAAAGLGIFAAWYSSLDRQLALIPDDQARDQYGNPYRSDAEEIADKQEALLRTGGQIADVARWLLYAGLILLAAGLVIAYVRYRIRRRQWRREAELARQRYELERQQRKARRQQRLQRWRLR